MRPRNRTRTGNICSQSIAWVGLHFRDRFGEAQFGVIPSSSLETSRGMTAGHAMPGDEKGQSRGNYKSSADRRPRFSKALQSTDLSARKRLDELELST